MRYVPLTALDEYFLHLETGAEPWNSHLEVRVEGRLDAERVAAAIRSGMARHPIARARLVEKEAGTHLLRLGREQTAALRARRWPPATGNDLLLAGGRR